MKLYIKVKLFYLFADNYLYDVNFDNHSSKNQTL